MLQKIILCGVEGDSPLDHNLKIINVISFVGGGFVLLYILTFGILTALFPVAYWKVLLSLAVYYPLFITPFYFTKRRKRTLAGVNIILAGFYATIMQSLLVFGHGAGVHYYAIAIPALALLMFSRKDDIQYFLFFALLCTGGFFYDEYFLQKTLWISLPPEFPVRYLHMLNTVGTIFLVAVSVYVFAHDLNYARSKITQEHERANNLLLNILPEPIATRLKKNTETIADGFVSASILFADIVGFTQLASRFSPEALVDLLNKYFSRYDVLTEKYGLEKIKTIGDAYMVAAGIPDPCQDHAHRIAGFALEMMQVTRQISREINVPITLRIGINSGPVTAGVIGTKKFIYDLWGDAVNMAARMESHGLPDKIQITQETYGLIKESFVFEEREIIEVKGKGHVRTYIVTAEKEKSARLSA